MRIDFKLLLCSIILLASCQSRLTFEGRRYTKGVYWNVSHNPYKINKAIQHKFTKQSKLNTSSIDCKPITIKEYNAIAQEQNNKGQEQYNLIAFKIKRKKTVNSINFQSSIVAKPKLNDNFKIEGLKSVRNKNNKNTSQVLKKLIDNGLQKLIITLLILLNIFLLTLGIFCLLFNEIEPAFVIFTLFALLCFKITFKIILLKPKSELKDKIFKKLNRYVSILISIIIALILLHK